MLTIALDMDDTTFDLVNPWLEIHNKTYKEKIKKTDIRSFGIHEYSKVGHKVYDTLAVPGLYENLKPFDGAKEVIEKLFNKGHTICFASASPKTAYYEKHMSIKKNFPFIDTDNIVFTKNKRLVNAHMLIDDGIHNIEAFKGIKVLYTQPWNEKAEYIYKQQGKNVDFIRVNDWIDIANLFEYISQLIDGLNSSNENLYFNIVASTLEDVQYINKTLEILR